MSRNGVQDSAINTAGTAAKQSTASYGTLAPQLTQMATNPTGYTSQQKSDMLTAGSQSTGGAVAGATGYGNLEAARTNNAGGFGVALDDASRQGMAQNSQNALGVQNQNAQLMQRQQAMGLQGLGNIYGDANATNLGALGQATNASNSSNANTLGWTKLGLGALGGLGG